MKRLRFIAILAGVGLFIGYWDTVMNYWDKWTQPRSVATRELEPGQEFFCPMDPQVVRSTYEPNGDVPKCPICGMPLSMRKKGEKTKLPAGITAPRATLARANPIGGHQDRGRRVSAGGPRDQDGGLRDLRREPAVADRQPRGGLRGEALRGQDLHHRPQGRPAGRNLQPRTLQHGPGVDPGQPRQGRRQIWPPARGNKLLLLGVSPQEIDAHCRRRPSARRGW